MEKIKVAIVGVSGFGRVHYEDILRAYKAGRVEIVCATVINQEEESDKCDTLRQCGCTIFDDAREMFRWFAGKVDVCFLPVGIGLHAPMSIAAMRAGMNVFLEKPLTATVQEADEIIAVSKETGRFVAVGYQLMYQPQVREMKRAILAGEIGSVKAIRGIGLWPRGRLYYNRNNWAGKLRTDKGWILDSPVNNALAHYLNLICYLGGKQLDEMAEVNSLQVGLYRANPKIESFDTAFFSMKSASCPHLFFATSHVAHDNLDPIIDVIGETGRIQWTQASYAIKRGDAATETVAMSSPEEIRDNIMDAVLKRVESPDSFVFTPECARVLTELVNAAHASTPIVQIPEDLVLKVPGKLAGDERCVWNGLDPIIRRTFDEIRLPTESDFAFCKNGLQTDPVEMTCFKGSPG